jgi:orotate phosphoribosyltransferase
VTTIKRGVEIAAREVVARRTEELFRSSGALRAGHFQLKSGRHGDAYLEKFAVLSNPAATSELCGFWAAEYRQADLTTVDIVAAPTTGGIILAFETARQLGTPGIFAEEVKAADGTLRRAFRRGFRIERSQRVLLLDDILTTGGSLLAMLPAVEALGGEVVACHVLVDRSGEDRSTIASPASDRVYPLRSLWRLDLPTYEAGSGSCPLCAARAPLETPGAGGAAGA